MEEILEVGLVEDSDDDEIEMIIMDNILIDRDHVHQGQNPFNLDDYTDEKIVINFHFERAYLPVLFDLQFPKEILNHQCILLKSVGGSMIVWPSSAVAKMKSNDTDSNPLGRTITTLEISLLTATPSFAAILGSLLLPIMADKIGRKKSLQVISLGMFVSQVGLAFSKNIPLMVTFYSSSNIFYAGVIAILPIYLTEICEDHNRAKYGCLMSEFLPLGQLYSYIIGPLFNLKYYTLLITAIYIPFFLLFPFAPESPVYFLANGRKEECIKTLKNLRNNKTSAEIVIDFNNISQSLSASKPSNRSNFIKVFESREGRIGLVLAIMPLFAQFLCGVPIIMALMAPIFNEAKISISGSSVAIIVGIFKVCSYTFTSLVVEKTGRRPMLLLSATGAGIPISVLGLFFYLKHINSPFINNIQWLPVLSIVSFIFFYSMGLGPLPVAIMSELFPTDIRSSAIGFTTSISGLGMAIYFFIYPIFAEMLGIHWCLWVFGSVCFVSATLFYLFLPETKGKSIHEIQEMLKKY